MAKKLKDIKAEPYNEIIENELVEEETYDEEIFDDDIDEEEIDLEEKPKKEKKIKIKKEKSEEEYEDANKTFARSKMDILIKVLNVVFVIAIIIMILICIDVVSVAKYNKGPFFAIKTSELEDGGTKVYYGLGYKVIKYNQLMGRKDTQIGFWNMPYNTTPTKIKDVDLAIEFQNNPEKAGKKYYKQYIAVSSKVKSYDKEENEITLEYTDPDGKYTLQIICPLSNEQEIEEIKEQQEIIIKGTAYKFLIKENNEPNKVFLSNCFIEK